MTDSEGDDVADGGDADTRELNPTVADLGATVLGAAFIGLSIAPTDEVPMIASTMDPEWQLVVVAVSLVTSYAIVFVAGFSRRSEEHPSELQSLMRISYAVLCLKNKNTHTTNDTLPNTDK